MKLKNTHVLLLAVLLIGLLAGCGPQSSTLTGDDREAVLDFSETKTDNLLAGMNAGDYATFSQDFDEAMRKAMDEAAFLKMKTDREAKFGQYLSREVSNVVQTGDFYAVNYIAKFENDDAVGVRVVFRIAEPHQVSGLWFNK
jgi:hypothetical protein